MTVWTSGPRAPHSRGSGFREIGPSSTRRVHSRHPCARFRRGFSSASSRPLARAGNAALPGRRHRVRRAHRLDARSAQRGGARARLEPGGRTVRGGASRRAQRGSGEQRRVSAEPVAQQRRAALQRPDRHGDALRRPGGGGRRGVLGGRLVVAVALHRRPSRRRAARARAELERGDGERPARSDFVVTLLARARLLRSAARRGSGRRRATRASHARSEGFATRRIACAPARRPSRTSCAHDSSSRRDASSRSRRATPCRPPRTRSAVSSARTGRSARDACVARSASARAERQRDRSSRASTCAPQVQSTEAAARAADAATRAAKLALLAGHSARRRLQLGDADRR